MSDYLQTVFGPLENLNETDATVRHQRAGAISLITLNRPDRMNAIDPATHALLREVVAAAEADPQTRVAVITGAGKAFCAGGDISSMGGSFFAGAPRKPVRTPGRHLFHELLRFEKPLIAMVNGVAAGLGATIALSADIVRMSDTARIGDTHVKVGLVAGDGGAVHWPLLVGPAKAKEMLMTGRLLDANDAESIGLVSKVHPAEELAPAVFELASELAALPPYAVQATKASVNRLVEVATSVALDVSSGYEHHSMEMDDHREAVAAFREKRAGDYTGR